MNAPSTAACAAAFVFVVWLAMFDRLAGRRRPGGRVRRHVALHWPARRRRADLAAMFDGLARTVRAGGALGPALAVWSDGTESVPAALEAAVARHRRGAALADACRPVADERDPSLALAGATLCALARCGAAGGRALDAAAAALRERAALAAEVRAHAATARLSAVVLALLPVVFATWTIIGDAAARGFLLGSAAGWAVTAAGLALDAVGAWWMRRLVAAAVPS